MELAPQQWKFGKLAPVPWFSRVVVSDFRSLRGDIDFSPFWRANLRRQKSRSKLEEAGLARRSSG
jgi:hypothetical protein